VQAQLDEYWTHWAALAGYEFDVLGAKAAPSGNQPDRCPIRQPAPGPQLALADGLWRDRRSHWRGTPPLSYR